MSEDKVRRHVTVEGEVQGVFFRETVRRKASEAGVAGWVENCSDGSVEAVFEGPAGSLDEPGADCPSGPPAAPDREGGRVLFRSSEAGVAGWIENCSDGSVEAVFEGPAESVDELVEYCRSGPTAA